MPEERREQVTRVVIEQSQRLTGGTRRSRWKAAAFNGWHEPDKSRGLCPESVSGSGCKPPGRLGRPPAMGAGYSVELHDLEIDRTSCSRFWPTSSGFCSLPQLTCCCRSYAACL